MSPQTKEILRRLLLGIFVGEAILTVSILGYYLYTERTTPQIPAEIHYTHSEAPIATGIPVELRIPALNIQTNIQSVGLAKNGSGEMGVPTNFTDVAWYNEGPHPGMDGSAVLAGHLNGRGVPKAVFYDLDALKPGDVVEVLDDTGNLIQFEVMAVKTFDYTDSTEEIFLGEGDKPRLNLITCAGDWLKGERLYNKRTVVFTELLGVVEETNH